MTLNFAKRAGQRPIRAGAAPEALLVQFIVTKVFRNTALPFDSLPAQSVPD